MKNNEFRTNILDQDYYHITSKNYIEQLKDKDNIVIWGSSNAGQVIYDFLEEFQLHHKIVYYVDNSKEKWGTKKNDILVISPDELISMKDKQINIIIASMYLSPIKKQLLTLGFNNKAIDTKGLQIAKDYLAFKNETPYMMIYSSLEKYEKVFNYLSDDRSKEVYLGLLNCKISLDNKYLEGISDPEEDQYFDQGIIYLSKDEVFCDCGSYNGDTLDKYISLSQGKYKKYIAIEADKNTFTELEIKIRQNNYQNILPINVACWNEKTILHFQSAQSAGHVTENGEVSVQADCLDNILKNEEVTFIKMDIEGAEENALMGACKTIQSHKPILAISIYHNLKDLYKLPLLMKDLNPEYKLFIRHYTEMFDHETVCYAIPKERCAGDNK
ncbi:FkbM family methyltransferase [Mobilitalea sibirica]|uniref:FkbM family methyltransferase n=1 Tax=Mobilitalea sibirica TaxID=1462919 RepID=A0A8J7HDU1_9FIRM|nr:FkbM family methyltransferase [Mobilitalea sibirica]MBH1942487.1 FkbM family methyltransferase [Mobilitalea sibirica]